MLTDLSIAFAVELAAFIDRELFLRRAARTGHRRPALLDDVAWVGVAVVVGLLTPARVTRPVEHGRVALLSGGRGLVVLAEELLEPVRHEAVVPGRRYNHASRRIRLVA